MPKFTFRERRAVGDRFVQFLKDMGQEHESSREVLRGIYSWKFKNSLVGETVPSFSSVLYTMGKSSRAEVRGDFVRFGKVKKTVVVADMYRRPQPKAGDQPTADQTPGPSQGPRRGRARDRAEFISTKHGVNVVSEHDRVNGRIRFAVTRNVPKTVTIQVQNNGTGPVTFLRCRPLRRQRELKFHDTQKVTCGQSLLLAPGNTHLIEVRCLTQNYGYFPVTLLFEFTADETGPFSTGRFVSAVANSRLAEELGPTAPYTPYQDGLQKPLTVLTEEGVPPDSSQRSDLEQDIPLPQYNYPQSLKDTIRHVPGTGTNNEWARLRSSLDAPLQFGNYMEKFQLLLHLEEVQMEVDIRRYDLQNTPMVHDSDNKRLLVLKVPGVAENRPSVLRGDHLFATLSSERGRRGLVQYKGYVHRVELERVKLGFSKGLLDCFVNNLLFDVTFTFNRLPLRVQHRAVQLATKQDLKDVLFPSFSAEMSFLQDGAQLRLFDRSLESNKEQCEAVRGIVSGLSRPAPYLIFGPPGTGKTVTMVEAIKQVLDRIKGSHVLACAPSNSAADLLCQRLLQHRDAREIYRLNASSRDYSQVPAAIKPCCNWDKAQGSYVYPGRDELQRYRVLVTTLVTAGRLVSAAFPPGHFSHVFIDECGHAVEPESVTAVAGMLSVMDQDTNPGGGQLVLAGDPKQLGPILRSPLGIEHGLGVSLLERLMHHNSLYQKAGGSYRSQFVTKLLRNYRSHAAIFEIPNELFYEGELQEHADRGITHSYCAWPELPKQGFPIIFHGVQGEDQREEKSPSFFNVAEIDAVVTYLKKLLKSQAKKGVPRISPKDIGIISPYRKQVEKIRKAITSLDQELKALPDIQELKVGSVEEFQGQERRVILVSTVRSCSEYLDMDEQFKLGFLKSPQRFNVAVTRAKALLIIVGNPMVLSKDPHWSRFLQYCLSGQGYTGYPYSEDAMDGDALADDLGALNLSEQPAGAQARESHLQQQVEPMWRHEH
ncbi:helicase MOV-10 [Alligator mississippiensis]|uniref:RNA helicase n=1 Tax=Alligator mississippiensis TaxID=8496 RepID=A0A151MTM9_ALLMI|nr:helicase MOV-10 [Alligator mississippiensis]KYO27871.1 putative helicase MOV-10 [Alligator mississippiensis]